MSLGILESERWKIHGLTLTIMGQREQIERYQARTPPGWLEAAERCESAERPEFELVVQLVDAPLRLPSTAIRDEGRAFAGGRLYLANPCLGGPQWMSLEADGPQRWILNRQAGLGGRDIETGLMRIACLRTGRLSLHAAVSRRDATGVAWIGGPGAGKTGALLADWNQNASWVSDDEAYWERSTDRLWGTGESVEVKAKYLKQSPPLASLVPGRSRRRLAFARWMRFGAGIASHSPGLSTRLRSRLTRIGNSESRIRLELPRRIPSTVVQAAVLAYYGESIRLEHLNPDQWTSRACEILWPEVNWVHQQHRALHAATGEVLIAGEREDEFRLKSLLREFVATKATYYLVRPPRIPWQEFAALTQPIYDAAASNLIEPGDRECSEPANPYPFQDLATRSVV